MFWVYNKMPPAGSYAPKGVAINGRRLANPSNVKARGGEAIVIVRNPIACYCGCRGIRGVEVRQGQKKITAPVLKCAVIF